MITAANDAFRNGNTISVERNKNLKFKAIPYGDTVWPAGTPIWTVDGIVKATGSDTYIVDTSATDASFTVVASCGISQKSIQIRTFNINSVCMCRVQEARVL